jgi:hypothetical protein
VTRLACTLGTSPCSEIATSVASSMRLCAGFGVAPVSSSQKKSVKLVRPMISAHRSRPRTMIISAFDEEIEDARSFCRPIFMLPRC